MSDSKTVSPPIRKRAAVIYNPVAGFFQRGRLRRFLKHLRGRGHEVLLRKTEFAGHATEIARSIPIGSVDVVVAAGGDGTINEVANGLIGRPIPMAIAPLGTANVLTFELGMGLGMRHAAALPSEGHVVEVRPAMVDGRGFLLMVSAGADARVVARVGSRLKRLTGKFAYVVAALREIFAGTQTGIDVTVDGVAYRAGLVIVTHASHYAGPFVIAPDARLGEMAVRVVLVPETGRLGLLGYGLALVMNRISRQSGVRILKAHQVRIDGPAGQPIQSDGDTIGIAPVDIALGDSPLQMLVPDPNRVLPVTHADVPNDGRAKAENLAVARG